MARNLTTNLQIDNFIAQVLVQAGHHAPHVTTAISHLEVEVRTRLMLGVDKLEVYERNGKLARTCWVTLGGNRYVFTYNYDDLKIDLRRGSLQGPLIYQFTNSTTLGAIRTQIGRL